jgi:hypothetical protein
MSSCFWYSSLVLDEGTRLFPDCTAPVDLALVSAQTTGPAVRLIYTRPGCQYALTAGSK